MAIWKKCPFQVICAGLTLQHIILTTIFQILPRPNGVNHPVHHNLKHVQVKFHFIFFRANPWQRSRYTSPWKHARSITGTASRSWRKPGRDTRPASSSSATSKVTHYETRSPYYFIFFTIPSWIFYFVFSNAHCHSAREPLFACFTLYQF